MGSFCGIDIDSSTIDSSQYRGPREELTSWPWIFRHLRLCFHSELQYFNIASTQSRVPDFSLIFGAEWQHFSGEYIDLMIFSVMVLICVCVYVSELQWFPSSIYNSDSCVIRILRGTRHFITKMPQITSSPVTSVGKGKSNITASGGWWNNLFWGEYFCKSIFRSTTYHH